MLRYVSSARVRSADGSARRSADGDSGPRAPRSVRIGTGRFAVAIPASSCRRWSGTPRWRSARHRADRSSRPEAQERRRHRERVHRRRRHGGAPRAGRRGRWAADCAPRREIPREGARARPASGRRPCSSRCATSSKRGVRGRGRRPRSRRSSVARASPSTAASGASTPRRRSSPPAIVQSMDAIARWSQPAVIVVNIDRRINPWRDRRFLSAAAGRRRARR